MKRLTNVMGLVIGENQHAFVEGEQIMDAVMVANEVVDNFVGNKWGYHVQVGYGEGLWTC